MRLQALVPLRCASRPADGQNFYRYLPRRLAVTWPNQAWAADIAYIPMARDFIYLVVVMDWPSPAVMA